jgi:hypothetical protein
MALKMWLKLTTGAYVEKMFDFFLENETSDLNNILKCKNCLEVFLF